MSSPHAEYEEIPEWSHEKVEQALHDDDPDALRYAVVAIALHDEDWRYAQDLCVRLSTHAHFNVRGNAVLGFGHIARVHRRLDRAVVQPIIEAAMRDANDYVRGHGFDAADETAHFLGWKYDRKDVA
jgi:hypothetical protein